MTALTDDRAALLATICARDPADPAKLLHPGDGPRLVYADWLDDHGETAHGEFVRVQCELARLEAYRIDLFNGDTEWKRCDEESGIAASWCPNCGDCCCKNREESMSDEDCPLHSPDSLHCCLFWLDHKTDALRRRERELFVGQYGGGDLFVDADAQSVTGEVGITYTFARGFVTTVRAPLAALIGGECECRQWDTDSAMYYARSSCKRCSGTGRTPGHLAAIVAAHPLERVETTDREPAGPLQWGDSGDLYGWYLADGVVNADRLHWMPARLTDPKLWPDRATSGFVPRDYAMYPTRPDALDALSDALLRLGAARAKEMR